MDTFTLTILLIIATTFLASYIRRVTKDRCLKSFEGYVVTLELSDNTYHTGKLEIENTGLEIIYPESMNENGILKMSYILYKDEFNFLNAILRYHDQLTKNAQKRRNATLKKTYHPNLLRRTNRKINNFIKLIKDSLIEIATTLSGRLKSTNPNNILATNEKYTNRLNQEVVNTIDASYEPLLEKYVGNIVFALVKHPETPIRVTGVLKDYTQNYIELLEVTYTDGRVCDVVFPRRLCSIKGLSESHKNYSIFSSDFDIKRYKQFFSRTNVKKSKK